MKQRGLLLWLLVLGGLLASMFWMNGRTSTDPASEVPVSAFIERIEAGQVERANIEGPNITGVLKDGAGRIRTYSTERGPVVDALVRNGVPFEEARPSESNNFLLLALKIGIPLILILVLFRVMRKAGNNMQNMAMQAGSHKGKMVQENSVKTRFADVAGVEEAVEEAKDFVDFLKNPHDYSRLGGRIPKGILLVGPSGTGKTLLARAVAGEAGVPFISCSGSDFIEMFVGVGASRVRDLFQMGRRHAPCIIFIDELDAVGKKRAGATFGAGGHDEREQTLNQILVEMDGFDDNTGVMLMAATNRPDVLDSALTRAGRFDRTVHVPPPDIKGREAILRVHARKIALAEDADLTTIARGTPGMTGADLELLLNEAAIVAGKRKKAVVDNADLEDARGRLLMGPERRSSVISDREKRIVAYHESGHAIVGWFLEDADPVHRVTIIPRGMALGLTHSLPTEDRKLQSRSGLIADIKVLLGGRIAEEIAIGDITTGASNDLERATAIAQAMVTQVGMTDAGLRTFGKRDQGYLSYDYVQRDYSEETARKIDSAITRLLDDARTSVKELLTEKRHLLDAMAAALLELETLTDADLTGILGPRKGKDRKPAP